MNRNDAIMWFGRIATILFTIAVAWDMYSNQTLSREIRITTIIIVWMLVSTICGWQVYVAHKYDGMPIIPFSFRWVVATWLGSLALFLTWIILIGIVDGLYSHLRSAVMYWQFGTTTLWFASRWVTVQTPHHAGIGETGASGNGNGGGG